jgi:hypothetical protein
MVNINEIKVYVAELTNKNYIPSEDLFEVYNLDPYGNFIGLAIDNNMVRDELRGTNYVTYGLNELGDIQFVYDKHVERIREYVGIDLDTDGILDAMIELDDIADPVRELYLKSMLYYKTNQAGKPINEFKLRVKCYADFSNDFSEDLVSADVINTESDTLISEIKIKTHLTEEEIKNKFSNYIVS